MTFDPLAFHERAVRTPSHESVTEMRDLIVRTLTEAGVEPQVDETGNVIGNRGDGHPHIVLNTHMDTVPPHLPFERDGEIVRGRGACDAKASLAALLQAFLSVEPSSGRVTLAITPDEETHSIGADALRGTLDADAVIVGEPTGLDVCHAAKGRFEGTLTLTGETAHAAEPMSGANAVAAVEQALAAIRTFDRTRGPDVHRTLGSPTLTPTRIEGGQAINQVPGECSVAVDRRSVPPETADRFADTFADHVAAAVPSEVGVQFELTDRPTPFLEAFETPSDDPLVESLVATTGGAIRAFTAATEASYFAQEAPTVVFGPGDLTDDAGPVAHSDREYVDRRAIEAAGTAVRDVVLTYVS